MRYLQQHVSFAGSFFHCEAAVKRELEVDIQFLSV